MSGLHSGTETLARDAWHALARQAAQPRTAEEVVLREILVCEVADARYGIPIEAVREVVRLRPITPIPRVPSWVLGVVALRGEIVQVVDLQRRLAGSEVNFRRTTRFVVLHGTRERVTGLAVDAVCEVLRVAEDAFRPTEEDGQSLVAELCEDQGSFVSIVDVDALIGVEGHDV